MLDLVGHPEDWFSPNESQIIQRKGDNKEQTEVDVKTRRKNDNNTTKSQVCEFERYNLLGKTVITLTLPTVGRFIGR